MLRHNTKNTTEKHQILIMHITHFNLTFVIKYISHKILFSLPLKDARIVDPAENWMFQGNMFNFENLPYTFPYYLMKEIFSSSNNTLKMMFQSNGWSYDPTNDLSKD